MSKLPHSRYSVIIRIIYSVWFSLFFSPAIIMLRLNQLNKIINRYVARMLAISAKVILLYDTFNFQFVMNF